MRIRFKAKSDLELAGIPDIPCEIEVPIEPLSPWLERAIGEVELLPDLPVPQSPPAVPATPPTDNSPPAVQQSEIDKAAMVELVRRRVAREEGEVVKVTPDAVSQVVTVLKEVSKQAVAGNQIPEPDGKTVIGTVDDSGGIGLIS